MERKGTIKSLPEMYLFDDLVSLEIDSFIRKIMGK